MPIEVFCITNLYHCLTEIDRFIEHLFTRPSCKIFLSTKTVPQPLADPLSASKTIVTVPMPPQTELLPPKLQCIPDSSEHSTYSFS